MCCCFSYRLGAFLLLLGVTLTLPGCEMSRQSLSAQEVVVAAGACRQGVDVISESRSPARAKPPDDTVCFHHGRLATR